MPNRLAGETSPYLLQHADNPVDWYPWGPEAFEAARRQDKPIFLSIGYAACHWCHVMAHESFEDPETAALMNELYVNVKVDREERPDVDQIYMTAIQVLGQGGGWPLSAWCTPDGKPYFVGTYFPPEERYGRPGFRQVLRILADLYRNERDKVQHNVDAILDGLRAIDAHYRGRAGGASPAALSTDTIVAAGRFLVQRSDPHHGGFGGAPKFPSSSAHALLARAGRLPHGEPAREAFLRQCMAMARGGLYDHVGGGFARYSVDERWDIPHFEKMLYDNAQLLAIYGDAFALTGHPRYERVIRETTAWLVREMSHASGGLYASQDADSEGEEGKYYVWTPAQLRDALGPDDAEVIARAFGVTDAGNFEGGTTHLRRVTPDGDPEEEARIDRLLAALFEVRDRRVHPATDTKVLAAWNALAVTGLVRAYEATGYEPARALALRVGRFLAERMVDGDRVARVLGKDLDGTIDDYAFCAEAFLRLAELTEDAAWWHRGAALVAAVVDRFYEDVDGGVFYLTPDDGGDALIHRPESHHDGALPSGAAVTVANLVRIGHVAGDTRSVDLAERYLARRARDLSPLVAARLLAAADDYLHGEQVVVTAGAGREALLAATRRAYAPARCLAGPWAAPSVLAGKEPAPDGRARAYVCRGQTCLEPVTDPDALAGL
ncbi:MAG: thioredoxin domain-containing protein [Deltaproteobacteria bacterium]|nr:MAG: thioredoxin domain-containing protein [Deltaproteobacteria bacterium]